MSPGLPAARRKARCYYKQLDLFADYPDGAPEFVWMLTSVVICELAVTTDDYLLDIQRKVFVFLVISSVLLKNVVVEVDFARTASDDDFSAAV
jgi:hypothetical protein